MIKEFEGTCESTEGQILLVASKFNIEIVKKLVDGALHTFSQNNIQDEQITLVWVPGAFEIPFMLKKMCSTKQFSGAVALGTVIQGETAHFDFISQECIQGVKKVSLKLDIPITLGVLTTFTTEQAEARAGGPMGNQGEHAAKALLEVLSVLKKVKL